MKANKHQCLTCWGTRLAVGEKCRRCGTVLEADAVARVRDKAAACEVVEATVEPTQEAKPVNGVSYAKLNEFFQKRDEACVEAKLNEPFLFIGGSMMYVKRMKAFDENWKPIKKENYLYLPYQRLGYGYLPLPKKNKHFRSRIKRLHHTKRKGK